MPSGSSPHPSDDDLVDKLQSDLQLRMQARRDRLEQRTQLYDYSDEEYASTGLKAFHGICDKWAIGAEAAEKILRLESNGAKSNPVDLFERISYVLSIYSLVNDVVQGDDARQQDWIRRANPSLDGQRPIDLMASGPQGSVLVMEYLDYCKYGYSH